MLSRYLCGWSPLLIAIACLIASGAADAITKKKPTAATTAARTAPAAPEVRRWQLPVATATSAGPGQAGYVHYFVLTHPDGTLESHVGIELHDQRIAWSFPGLGVSVSAFIKSGSLLANGVEYGVEHLYGIRPFPDDARMDALQDDITSRVAQWVDDEVPYCYFRVRNGPFCVSCGDFVVRVLFPGRTYQTAVLPREFLYAPPGAGITYSTDDLLLWLVGLNELPSHEARMKRIAELALPPGLREDLVDLVKSIEPNATSTPGVAQSPRPQKLRARPGVPAMQRAVKPPPQPAKRL